MVCFILSFSSKCFNVLMLFTWLRVVLVCLSLFKEIETKSNENYRINKKEIGV